MENELPVCICDTQLFLNGQIKKKFVEKIIDILKTIPIDKTSIEIKLIYKLEGKLIEHIILKGD